MKRKWSLLLVICCACFCSIAGSQIHSSEQAGRDSPKPSQPPAASTTPATTTSEHSGGTVTSVSEVADEVYLFHQHYL
jgi:hypothetical protein